MYIIITKIVIQKKQKNMKTKLEVIQEIVKIQHPIDKWKRSLEASSIERCNYSKKELVDILNNLKK
jgi:hypothetical protein